MPHNGLMYNADRKGFRIVLERDLSILKPVCGIISLLSYPAGVESGPPFGTEHVAELLL